MQAHKKLFPNKEGFTREIPVLVQGFTREKIDIILGLGCEKPCESLYYLGTFLILIHWAEVYPILIHWPQLYPILIHWTELYPTLIHWTELYPILIQCRTIPYLNTLQSAANQIRVLRHANRQPIRIEHYVTRELSARPEVPSRLSTRLGSRLDSARYSLS